MYKNHDHWYGLINIVRITATPICHFLEKLLSKKDARSHFGSLTTNTEVEKNPKDKKALLCTWLHDNTLARELDPSCVFYMRPPNQHYI